MNGIHDLGGMHGFRFPRREKNEPVFKYDWEKQLFSAAIAYNSPWSIDESRFTIESMPPREYLRGPYYARWLYAIEKLLVKYKVATEQELKNPDGAIKKDQNARPANADTILKALKDGNSARRIRGKAARFRVGDRVVVKNDHPEWHTRCPRYVRGHQGSIYLDHGVFVFPDSNSRGEGERPQHCYNVVFTAPELWGGRANPKDRIFVDLFDDYLEEIRR